MTLTDERPGVWLALDWGMARIGVAACDPDGLLAFPVETVKAGMKAHQRLLEIVAERQPAQVIVGLPRSLSGADGPAAIRIRGYAQRLADELDVPVVLVDERLTTVEGARRLHEAGLDARHQRGVIDQAAAVAILDNALERFKHGERRFGQVLSRTT